MLRQKKIIRKPVWKGCPSHVHTIFYKIKVKCGDGKIHQIDLEQPIVYKPAIPQIVKGLFQVELREARKRVSLVCGYNYTPSREYVKAIEKMFRQQRVKRYEKGLWD